MSQILYRRAEVDTILFVKRGQTKSGSNWLLADCKGGNKISAFFNRRAKKLVTIYNRTFLISLLIIEI